MGAAVEACPLFFRNSEVHVPDAAADDNTPKMWPFLYMRWCKPFHVPPVLHERGHVFLAGLAQAFGVPGHTVTDRTPGQWHESFGVFSQ